MARSDPMADASLPAIRARSRPGTAIAAMMPMMATTISNSIRVNPQFFSVLIFATYCRLLSCRVTRFSGQKKGCLQKQASLSYLLEALLDRRAVGRGAAGESGEHDHCGRGVGILEERVVLVRAEEAHAGGVR